MGPGSQAREVRADTRQVWVELERGDLNVRVNGNEETRWRVVAGRFTVTVLGTVFHVSHGPDDTRFEVRVTEGRVSVADSASYNATLNAGERFVSDKDGMRIDRATYPSRRSGDRASVPVSTQSDEPPLQPASPSQEGKRERAPKKSSDAAEQKEATEPTEADTDQAPPWLALVHRGEWQPAIALMKEADLPALIEKVDENALWHLANAARHSRRNVVATALLEAVRKKSSAPQRRATAAFLLGRITDTTGTFEKAKQWYLIYLEEAADGPLAETALGKLIAAAWRAGDIRQSKDAALQYRSKYPNGIYTSVAKSVLARRDSGGKND